MSGLSTSIYRRLVRTPGVGADGEPEEVGPDAARNGLHILSANTLQSTADQLVNAKTVLPWLLTSVGAPAALVGLLVPIRESGSMLPQAELAGWFRRRRYRAPVWVAGAAGQAGAAAAMTVAALTLHGVLAGVAILVALGALALARSLSSLAGKDVLGRTVAKGQRGQLTGTAAAAGGGFGVAVGLGLRLGGGAQVGVTALVVLLAVATLLWAAAGGVFSRVDEPPATPEPGASGQAQPASQLHHLVQLVRSEPTFRRFVAVRTLLLVSALSTPFVVSLSVESGGAALRRLGTFVVAAGLASAVGGRFFGRAADRSSRRLMMAGAGTASAVIVVFLGLLTVPAVRGFELVYPAVFLLLSLAHTAIRVARKTYVIDLASDERRVDYVAVSNSAIGALLLVTGALTSALALFGAQLALGLLAALGVAGVLLATTLPEVDRP